MSTIPDPRQEPILSIRRAAEVMGEGQKAVRKAAAAGQIPSLRIGRYVRIPTAPLLQLMGVSSGEMQAGDEVPTS